MQDRTRPSGTAPSGGSYKAHKVKQQGASQAAQRTPNEQAPVLVPAMPSVGPAAAPASAPKANPLESTAPKTQPLASAPPKAELATAPKAELATAPKASPTQPHAPPAQSQTKLHVAAPFVSPSNGQRWRQATILGAVSVALIAAAVMARSRFFR